MIWRNNMSIKKDTIFATDELSNIMKQKNGNKIIEEGAENGNLECQQLLYNIHYIGRNVDKENKDKFEYYTMLAAHQNDSVAQFNHAKNIYDSIIELKQEYIQKNGGVNPVSGTDIKAKLDDAKAWYSKAYKNGNITAENSLKELSKIIDWIDSMVYYTKGNDYHDKKNPDKAIEYYKKAAKLGYKNAYYNLGIMHYNTILIDPNIPKAINYFQKGCDANDAGSCFMYGLLLYEQKEATREDLSKAKELFKKAMDNGDEEAKNYYYYLDQEGY